MRQSPHLQIKFLYIFILLFFLLPTIVHAGTIPFAHTCSNDGQCLNNMDCETANLPDGKSPSICTCRTSEHCASTYGGTATEWECTQKHDDTVHNLHYCVRLSSNQLMDPIALSPDENIKKWANKSSNGFFGELLNVATDAEGYVQQFQNESQAIINKPTPKISIPGVSFSEVKQVQRADGSVYLQVPFLGEYISSLYKYIVIVSGIVATIVLIVAGIQWMAPGNIITQDEKNINQAKNRIQKAIIGLALIVTSYTILYVVNPELVQFRSLQIQYIPGKSIAEVSVMSADNYTAITGQPLKIDETSRAQNVQIAAAVAAQYHLDPCLAVVIVKHESRGNPAVVGHDEDYPGPNAVGARYDFLKSGKKFSGETFAVPQNVPATKSAYNKMPSDGRNNVNNVSIFNNDGSKATRKQADIGNPPDYGLDWRFTHGFGLGQVTIGGNAYCDKSKGIRGAKISALNKCLTVPELLSPQGGVEALVGRLLYWYRKSKTYEKYNGPDENIPENVARRTFAMYGAGYPGGDIHRASANSRVQHFLECKQSGAGTQTVSKDPTPAFTELATPDESDTSE